MNDLLSAGIAGGIAAIALARGRTRTLAIPVTVLLSTSLIVQLTRARWIGMIGGIVVVSLWLALRGEHGVATVLRRRLAQMGMVLISVIAMALVAAPSVVTGGPLANRFLSIFTDVSSANVQKSTVAVREHVASLIAGLLGSHWLLGLGLIPPAVHYYLALPNGGLRDPDVGALNAIVTIGAIGTVLIYLPVVLALIGGLRRPPAGEEKRTPWLVFGGAIFIVTSIISSVTLGTLFSVGGLVLTAVVLSLMCQAAESRSVASVPATEAEDVASESLASGVPLPDVPLAGAAVASGASFGAREPAGLQVLGERSGIDLGFEWEAGDRIADLRPRTPIGRDRGRIPPGQWNDSTEALAALAQPHQNGGSRARPYRSVAETRLIRMLVVGGVLIAGLLGFLLARTLIGSGTSSQTPQYASAGSMSLTYPAGWRQHAVPASPALEITDGIAVAPPGPARGLLVVGREIAPDSAFLPPSLHEAIAQLGTAQVTVLNGTRAYRYLDQTVAGIAGAATIYGIPTAQGTILGICETQRAAATFAATCERAVASARLASGAPAAGPPSASYDAALSEAMTKLNVARSQGGAALARAGTPKTQAAAAAALAAAHLNAAATIGKLDAGSAQPQKLALSRALRSVGNAYRALRSAAARNDARGYAAARSLVLAANSRLGAAVLRLDTPGAG